MSTGRAVGRIRAKRGSVKEALGKVLGDTRVEAEGAAEKRSGRIKSESSVRGPSVPNRGGASVKKSDF